MSKMGKSKEAGLAATWDLDSTLIYCNCCIKEIELGNRPNTHFNKEGWENLTRNFQEQTGKNYDRMQMKNRWDQLKKDWKLWKELLRGETGIGWNPIKKTVDASDDWWTEKLKIVPAARKFRYTGITPELEEKLNIMFMRIVATGDNVWYPSTGLMPPELINDNIDSHAEDNSEEQELNNHPEEVEVFEVDNSQRSTAICQTRSINKKKPKKLRSGGKQHFMNNIEDLANSTRSISYSVSAMNPATTIERINLAIQKMNGMPEIWNNAQLYYFATGFMQDQNNREIFLNVPDERKYQWLIKRKLESDSVIADKQRLFNY